MNNSHFNYWLQGFFEITERDTNQSIEQELTPSLSEAQVICIREHLDLVKKQEPLYGFAAWLEGYIDARVGTVGGDISTQGYMAISEKLKESFRHVTTQTTHGQALSQAMAGIASMGGIGGMGSSLLTC